ncbi:MAG: hypothetical protein HUU22_12825 [Phycisphaerae bacterium]|nr:hypothetical protein [Phycisphaerae bacterium]NUQ46902.1 hypothetical protein [Phycisphaerae bacterium]
MNETPASARTADRPRGVAAPAVEGGKSMPAAGLLAWLAPGLGHWYLGYRDRAIVFFVFTTVTFWAGVAVGGVKSTVHPTRNGAWFAAQLWMGGQALAAWGAGSYVERHYPANEQLKYTAFYPSDNIAVIYTGITGLLNLLIVIDALARSDVRTVQTMPRPPTGTARRG